MREAHAVIAITGLGSVSSLGSCEEGVWRMCVSRESRIKPVPFDGERVPVARLSDESEKIIESIRCENPNYKNFDKTVLMAIYAARVAVKHAGWKKSGDFARIGVNIGSSRGATNLLESRLAEYLANPSRRLFPHTSPLTTLGNISSSVAHDIESDGPAISHSVTCSTALHAVFNGIAWMRAGMADKFIVGGAEAPLTGFTIAQMKALRIYTSDVDAYYPCRPCSSESPLRDTLALGEGAAVFALETLTDEEVKAGTRRVLGVIESIGYAQENSKTATSITDEGGALQKSMRMALNGIENGSGVDLIILHAPGTIKGDRSELNAVYAVFGKNVPIMVSNKWMIGHSFGASGALSLEYALMILANNDYADFPYPVRFGNKRRSVRRVMINAAGFGGNAASLIVSRD